MPAPPNPVADPKGDSEEPPVPSDFLLPPPPWPGLDRLGLTQAIGGFVLALIALLSSYDHITFAGHAYPLPQQWGIPFIAASVATVVIDAQLATRSRLRAAHAALRAAEDAARAADETARERDLAARERNFASQERNRADQERLRADRERNRAAEARECQAESIECLRQAAVLSARVQLDPSDANRARLQAFLALIAQRPLEEDMG